MAHTMAELMCTQLVDAATPPACFRGSAHAFHSLRNDALKTNIAAGLLPRLQVVLPLARSRGVLPELAGVLTFWLSNGAAGTTQAAYDLYKQMLANALGGMWPQAVPWFVDSYAQRGCSAAGHMLCCMAAHWGEGGGKTPCSTTCRQGLQTLPTCKACPLQTRRSWCSCGATAGTTLARGQQWQPCWRTRNFTQTSSMLLRWSSCRSFTRCQQQRNGLFAASQTTCLQHCRDTLKVGHAKGANTNSLSGIKKKFKKKKK